MKRCNHCGQTVEDHCAVCPSCGLGIEKEDPMSDMIKCPECGRYIRKTDEFCGWCEADRRKQGLIEDLPEETVLPAPDPFYQSRWFLWLMLIFLAPIGIFLLWKYTDFPKMLKTLLSIGFAMIFILLTLLLCGVFEPIGTGYLPGEDASSGVSTEPSIRQLVVIRDDEKEKFLELGNEKLLKQLFDIGIQTIWKVSVDRDAGTIRLIADVTNDIVIQFEDGQVQSIYSDTDPRRYYYSTDRSYDIYSYRTGSVIKFADSTLKAERIAREKEEYVKEAQAFSYSEVERTPDQYLGKKAYFAGTVVQLVHEDDEILQLRVNVGSQQEQILFVNYVKPDDYKERILKDDWVEIYGEMDGLEKYIGADQTEVIIPRIKARYIDRIG